MAQLSQRENEVLQLAVRGLSNDEIATELAISRRTVETHMRTVFHKTGVTRRAQLVAMFRSGTRQGTAPPRAAEAARPAPRIAADRQLQLYAEAIRRLTDRQMALFDERVELTMTVGEQDGHDTVVERRWTTPKPYLIQRVLSPIVAWNDGPRVDPDELQLSCEVHGQDVFADECLMQDLDGDPMVLVLFQPGLRTLTEWTLRYRSPGLWDPLRADGSDTLVWDTATPDGRHRPSVDELTVRVVFPASWGGISVTEESGLGRGAPAERMPDGRTEVRWHDGMPIANRYQWVLRGGPTGG